MAGAVNGTVEVQDLVREHPAPMGGGCDTNRQASPKQLGDTLPVDRISGRERKTRERRKDSLGGWARVGEEVLVGPIEVVRRIQHRRGGEPEVPHLEFPIGLPAEQLVDV